MSICYSYTCVCIHNPTRPVRGRELPMGRGQDWNKHIENSELSQFAAQHVIRLRLKGKII